MRIGTIISMPDTYTRFARIRDNGGGGTYTVDTSEIPKSASIGDEMAYKVEIWGNDSGLAYDLKED